MLWYVITNETSMICYEIVRYWMKFQWYSRRFQCCVTVFVGKYMLDAYTVMLMFHWIFRFSFLTIFRSWLLWNSSKFSKKIKAKNQAITAKKKCFWKHDIISVVSAGELCILFLMFKRMHDNVIKYILFTYKHNCFSEIVNSGVTIP